MRRFLLVLLGGLALNAAVFAQLAAPTQTGKATQELNDSELSAAHFNIPLGSRVKIINTVTEKEIEVTIKGRIPPSSSRIIDLSPAAWAALGLAADTDVRVVPPPSTFSGSESHRAVVEDKLEEDDFTIKVHSSPLVASAWEIKIKAGDEERVLTIQARPNPQISVGDEKLPPDAFVLPYADEYVREYTEETAGKTAEQDALYHKDYAPVQTRTPIKVIPCLPDPNSGKIYRLQVGSYARTSAANGAERDLRAAGFNTKLESFGSYTRVLAVGIPAAAVRSAVQTIESAGFSEVWITE